MRSPALITVPLTSKPAPTAYDIGIAAAGRVEIGERRGEYGARIDRAKVTRTVERAAEQVDHALAQVLEVTRATHDKGIDRKHVAGDR